MTDCGFSRNALAVATASADGYARIWDAATGLLAYEPLYHPERVQLAEFSPDQTRLLTASGRTAQIWPLLSAPEGLPPWFLNLAESLAGVRMDEHGGIKKVPTDGYFRARDEVLQAPGGDPLTAWVRGFFAPQR